MVDISPCIKILPKFSSIKITVFSIDSLNPIFISIYSLEKHLRPELRRVIQSFLNRQIPIKHMIVNRLISQLIRKVFNNNKITMKSRPAQNRLLNWLEIWYFWQFLSSHIPNINVTFYWITARFLTFLFWMLFHSSLWNPLQVLVAIYIIEHLKCIDFLSILFETMQFIA